MMTLSSSHVLPPASFFHIAVMVGFMLVVAVLGMAGFLAVQTVTAGWEGEIKDTLSIELPSYSVKDQKVLTQDQIDRHLSEVMHYLKGDPLVTHIKIVRGEELVVARGAAMEGSEFDIPAPVFLTLFLNKDRADESEKRIKNNVIKIIPDVVVKESDVQFVEIERVAAMFRIVFSVMAVAIMGVTIVVLSAIIRSQLSANRGSVTLFYLFGARDRVIAGLYEKAVTRVAVFGAVAGLLMVLTLLYAVLIYNNVYSDFVSISCGAVAMVCVFVILSRWIARWTVMSFLKGMA